jgi:hypothetical protein
VHECIVCIAGGDGAFSAFGIWSVHVSFLFQINGYYCIAVVKVLVLLCIILCLAAMKGT